MRTRTKRPSATPTHVVGLGSSAGGLEACEQFFTHLPPDTGMAFVVVSHLDPNHKGIMPELLQRCTRMKVCQAADGMRARPNCVYVIPPNVDLSILHGKFQLLEPTAPRGLRLPIDFFFKHLALDRKERAVGIILSGMGTDGTQGLKALKEGLGLAMAQDPTSAKFDGMPRSAIGTGMVDIVAPAASLPARLTGFVQHAATLPPKVLPESEKPSTGLEKVFVLLRSRTGADFSGYKLTTIHRRIERRMSVHQLETLPHYVRYLQQNPQEVDLLFHELLIGVTNFFRDPSAFEALSEKALPRLLEKKDPGSPIRVWVAGCSTGEEAYSVMIALAEALERRKRGANWSVQMFATDLEGEAIEKARQGIFHANIAAELSPQRLRRFFNRDERGYVIKKEIRERIVFAQHNLLSDPPFTKLDLLCCRNVLIYLKADWQQKLLALFHFALNGGGVLFLGPAETIGSATDLFTTRNTRWKLFERKPSPEGLRVVAEMPGPRVVRAPHASGPHAPPPPPRPDVADVAQRLLLETCTAPAVVINPAGDIVYVVGRTGKYLEPATGKMNLNVLAMARPGLRLELVQAIGRALQRNATVTVENLHLKADGQDALNLTVRPLNLETEGDLLLVVFEEVEPTLAGGPKRARTLPAGRLARTLERELRQTKAHLQVTIEQMEATQEEIKAANEELQSNNEELQSTNEELTTSKEELQSLNEETVTVNAELQHKVDQLSQVNNDMRNLLNGIDVATIFADNDLLIKRFTSQATKIINLLPTDLGRPLTHFTTNLKYDRLVENAREVLATLVFKETQVQSKDGHWHLMRILPYRTADNVIDGLVMTFTDITALKQLEASLRESQAALDEARLFAESIIATIRQPLLVLDGELRIISASRSFYDNFRVTPAQTEQRLLSELGRGQWDIPELRRLLLEILPSQIEMRDFKVEHDFPALGPKVMLLNARQVRRPGPHAPLILLAIEDITPPA